MRGSSGWTTVAALALLAAALSGDAEPGKPRLQLPKDPKPGQAVVNPIDGSELVFIPGGAFMMGDDDSAEENEKPAHKVQVAGFWLGKHEVTNEQYEKFLKATGHASHLDGIRKALRDDKHFGQAKQPVVALTWDDAVAYCKWAGCRLPTEAEWEYAARGGQQYEHGTQTGALSRDLANTGRFRSPVTAESLTLAPVGSYPANPFGLHDMAGNVMEWTSSLWRDYPYNAEDGREDPNDKDQRVARGGAYTSSVWCRCAARYRLWPFSVCSDLGFRVAG